MIMKFPKIYGWKRTALYMFAAVMTGNVIISCSDDIEPVVPEQIEVVEPGGSNKPSDERVNVPVAMLTNDGSALYAALSSRCVLRDELTSASLGAVVVSCKDLTANTAAIVTAYKTGAIIVVTNPNDSQLASWCDSNGIPYMGDGDSETGHGHMLYCFNNNNDYYLLDDFIDESADNDYDAVLNSFTDWVNTYSLDARSKALNPTSRSMSRNGDFDIARTFASQSITHTFNISIKDGELAHVALSSADKLTKSSTIDVSYTIYPLYSFEANTTSGDFYLVKASVTVHNGGMFQGQWTKKHGGVHARLGGFYMSKFDIDATLCNVSIQNDGKRIFTDCTDACYPAGCTPVPESSVGSTTYQSGFSWGLNGSLSGGFKGNEPTGQLTLGGNFGWSNSESHNISDVTIEKNAPSNKAGYVFRINNLPHTSSAKLHTDIPTVAKSDFTMYQIWVWHVPTTKDYSTDVFGLKVHANVEYKGYHWYSSAADFSTKTFDNALPESERTYTIPLTAPNRVPYGQLILVNTSKTHQYLHSIKIWKNSTPASAAPDYTINQSIASSYMSSSSAGSSATLSLPAGKYRIEAVRCNISQQGEEYDRIQVECSDVNITLAKDTHLDGGGIAFRPKK